MYTQALIALLRWCAVKKPYKQTNKQGFHALDDEADHSASLDPNARYAMTLSEWGRSNW